MKVVVDFAMCASHGDCVVEAPEIFDIGDDDDKVVLLQDNPSESLRSKAIRAAASCPVSALKIVD